MKYFFLIALFGLLSFSSKIDSVKPGDKAPEIELININSEAVVTIFLGWSAFNKKSIGGKSGTK